MADSRGCQLCSCAIGGEGIAKKRACAHWWHSRALSRSLLAAFFISAGANHFRDPAFYLPAIPPRLPWRQRLIDVSGGAEILGGIGVLVPRTRRAAGWGLIALLIAVFPANVYAALRNVHPPRRDVNEWLLWVRLPLQAVLIAWTWWTTAAQPRKNSPW